MSTINARLRFHLPFATACEYFNNGFSHVALSGPQPMKLTARVPLTEIELSKTVLLECAPVPAASDPSWRLRWSPEPGGIYPSFEGTISAHAYGDDGTVLELSGAYTPPLEAAGQAFDHVIGHRFAIDTFHDILANIAAEMKAHYAFEEAREAYADVAQRPSGETRPDWNDVRF